MSKAAAIYKYLHTNKELIWAKLHHNVVNGEGG
jgi:hypothetical protein